MVKEPICLPCQPTNSPPSPGDRNRCMYYMRLTLLNVRLGYFDYISKIFKLLSFALRILYTVCPKKKTHQINEVTNCFLKKSGKDPVLLNWFLHDLQFKFYLLEKLIY